MFKKADIILAATLIAAALAISYIFSFGQSAGNTLEISCDGEIFGSYSLEKDREITINCGEHINKVIINKGTVSMSFSDCPGQHTAGSYITYRRNYRLSAQQNTS